MAQPSGSKVVTCPFCSCRYKVTNWMKRFHGPTTPDGRALKDTHQIACYAGRWTQTTEKRQKKEKDS